MHHVETAAQECARLAELPSTFALLQVTHLWAFGDVLGPPRELDSVSVALGVDLPPEAVAWWTEPSGSEHWVNMTRLPKNPVRWWWRSTNAHVWNHHITGPLLVWTEADGIDEAALGALKEGRGAASGHALPSDVQLAERLRDEQRISLAELASRTADFEERRWGRGRIDPLADALWRASFGYLDVLRAQRCD